jgi:hypothetical protein
MADWSACIFQTATLARPNCSCAYHTWLYHRRHNAPATNSSPVNKRRHVESSSIDNTLTTPVPESERLLYADTINPLSFLFIQKNIPVESNQHDLTLDTRWNRCKRRKTNRLQTHTISPGVLRLSRFLAVIKILQTAPWADEEFAINTSMLVRFIASHLPFIVGKKEWQKEKSELYPILHAHENLSGTQNLVWITNRQQGKTTTLGLFLAAMSFMSPHGDNLFCVYSTSQDRAQELTKKAKKYIYWVIEDPTVRQQLRELNLKIPEFLQDNERTYTVSGQYGTVWNTIHARPRNPVSCRGDAPAAAIVDEAGFVTNAFWDDFLYPLLQVRGRVVTCATTPPPLGSVFSVFVDMVIRKNLELDHFFFLVNHSLVCAPCYDANQATKCIHKFGLIPPWKSVLRLTQMKQLVPEKKMRAYEAEVFGIIQVGNNRYFPPKLVDATFTARKFRTVNPFTEPVATIYIAIDPASHHRSFMGITALTYGSNGEIILLGFSSVGVERCEVIQVQMVINRFIYALSQHVWIRQRHRLTQFKCVPIIECNNNEVMALSLLEAVKETCAGPNCNFIVVNPFIRELFDSDITPDLGVWTTHRNKEAGVLYLYSAILDGRVCIAINAVTVGEIYRVGAKHPTLDNQRALMGEQLKSFRDMPDGSISGKDANTDDDMGMSLLLAVYWSHCIRASSQTTHHRLQQNQLI